MDGDGQEAHCLDVRAGIPRTGSDAMAPVPKEHKGNTVQKREKKPRPAPKKGVSLL